MIVRRQDGTLVLVTQLDHSALSGELARHWGNARFARPQPLESAVLAGARHDEGWREQDERPLYDAAAQGPMHFRTIDVRIHVPFYREGIRRIVALDPYAGLLVSMHGSGIYQGRYGAGPVRMTTQTDEVRTLMEAFVSEQEALQAELKRRLWPAAERRSLFERGVWVNYELLQVWDLLSLFVCVDRHKAPVQRFGPVPVAIDGGDAELRVEADGDEIVRIEPWPFDVGMFEAVVPGRAIADRPYESQRTLRDALGRAAHAAIHCRFIPGQPA